MPSIKQINQAFARIHAEGQKLWQFTLIGPEIIPQMIALAEGGAEQELRLLAEFMPAVRRFKKNRALCLFCQTCFAKEAPAMMIAVHAGRDDPDEVIWSGLCLSCRLSFGKERTPEATQQAYDAISQKLLEFYTERLGAKDWRVLPKPFPPGRA